MLEVHQNNDLSNYIDKIQELNLDKDKVILIEAYDNSKVTGSLLYSMGNEIVTIHFTDYGNDRNLADGLVRTALFKASLIGIDKAELGEIKDTAKMLGFIKNDDTMLKSIQNVMGGCCNCKKNC